MAPHGGSGRLPRKRGSEDNLQKQAHQHRTYPYYSDHIKACFGMNYVFIHEKTAQVYMYWQNLFTDCKYNEQCGWI